MSHPYCPAGRRERLSKVQAILSTGDLTTAERLAEAIGCTERSIYRYVSLLRERGLPIRSESGVGYMMRAMARADVEAQFEVE